MLAATLERLHGSVRKSFGLVETTLGHENARPRLVNPYRAADVLKIKKKAPGTIEVCVCLVEISNGIKQIAEVILDASAIPQMPGLLKVETCGCELYESPVHLIFAIFGESKTVQNRTL